MADPLRSPRVILYHGHSNTADRKLIYHGDVLSHTSIPPQRGRSGFWTAPCFPMRTALPFFLESPELVPHGVWTAGSRCLSDPGLFYRRQKTLLYGGRTCPVRLDKHPSTTRPFRFLDGPLFSPRPDSRPPLIGRPFREVRPSAATRSRACRYAPYGPPHGDAPRRRVGPRGGGRCALAPGLGRPESPPCRRRGRARPSAG